jgi:hypothetical protein
MSDQELIVHFRPGLSEDEARALAESSGAKVRRRMRTDHADEVMLLLRSADVKALKATLDGSKDVLYTELNEGGFGIM